MEPVPKVYARFVLLALLVTLSVIVLGAYVRLSNAGLGCPDWPGCYGHMLVPAEAEQVESANRAFPGRPLESGKAWKEMAHRYLAGFLGIMIAALATWSFRLPGRPWKLPAAITGLVVVQALLGMWTVTLLLKPLVVVLHLLGGMTIAALLWWLWLRLRVVARNQLSQRCRGLAAGALLVLAIQISLGGWTSSNYAATACPDFPTCQQAFFPEADFSEAFVLWRGLGTDYEGGVLETPARVAIHLAHRLGAVFSFVIMMMLFVTGFRDSHGYGRAALIAMLGLLVLQLSLGVGLIKLGFPLMIAAAHNGTAALLLLSVVAVNHLVFADGDHAR